MELKPAVAGMILLISAVCLAGCTGSPSAPVAMPAPGSVAPAAATPPAAPSAKWNAATPAPDHPSSKTFSFQGSGDYDELTFTTTSDATWECSLLYPKTGIFTVILKNGRGEEVKVLANEGGGGSSRKSVWLKAGDYYFNVKADAPWYITMTTG